MDREIANARAGLPARIIGKMNQLEDRSITRKLYEASGAGVEIRLIVRGFCCLKPGVEGLSENIRVRSIIGQLIEHSRIFHFADGQEDPAEGVYLVGSADWMYRNLSDRVEAALPVRDRSARERLWRVLDIMWRDRFNAWEILGDGGTGAGARPGRRARHARGLGHLRLADGRGDGVGKPAAFPRRSGAGYLVSPE